MNEDKKIYIFSCPRETGELVETMAKHIIGGVEAIFQKGILLIGIALKANKQGHKLAIIDDNKNIIDIVEDLF